MTDPNIEAPYIIAAFIRKPSAQEGIVVGTILWFEDIFSLAADSKCFPQSILKKMQQLRGIKSLKNATKDLAFHRHLD